MSASHVATRHLYNGGLSLPGRLPWQAAKTVVLALFDGLNVARAATVGYEVGVLLGQSTAPYDAAAQAKVGAMLGLVECDAARRIADGSGPSSSASSSSSTPPPQMPQLPLPVPQAQQDPQGAAAAQPFVVDAASSLSANVERLVAQRLQRPLIAAEQTAIRAALDEGVSVLQAGDAAARQQLLLAPMATALAQSPGAHLWAAAVEAAEGEATVEAVARAVTEGCSRLAGVLFAAALGV
jgi:hypothetical protein